MTHGWYAKHRVEQLKPSVKRMRGSNDGAAESFLTWPAAVGCGIWGIKAEITIVKSHTITLQYYEPSYAKDPETSKNIHDHPRTSTNVQEHA